MGNRVNCCSSCKEDTEVKFEEGLGGLEIGGTRQGMEMIKEEENEIEAYGDVGDGDGVGGEGEVKGIKVKLKSKTEGLLEITNTSIHKVEDPPTPVSKEDIKEISKYKIYKKLHINKSKILSEKKDTIIIQGKVKKLYETTIKTIKNFKEVYVVINKEKICVFRSKEIFIQMGKPTEVVFVGDMTALRLNKKDDSFSVDYKVYDKGGIEKIGQGFEKAEIQTLEICGSEKGQLEEFVAVLYFLLINTVFPDFSNKN